MMTDQMTDSEATEQYAAYIDWSPPWSNVSLSDDHLALTSLGDAVICVVAAILSVITAGGNLLVVVSYRMDRHLQTVSNYLLLSLSVADFTIGAISMPLYTTYLVLGYWPLGPVFCDVWLSLDYTMSNASVANLLVISFDRYMSVTRPLTYRVRRTRRRAAAMIAGAWVVSTLLWTPWIVAWPHIEGHRTVPDDDCYIQFLKSNKYLTIATAVAAFYLPVVILCAVYYRIYRETRRHQRNLYELRANQLLRVHPGNKNTVRSELGNTANETVSTRWLAACRRRLGSSGPGLRGCCGWIMMSTECDSSDNVEVNFDEDTMFAVRDDGQPTSTSSLMCKSQSAPPETSPMLVSMVSDVVISPETSPILVSVVSDVVISPVDQSINSTTSSLAPSSQCQCSWHGGTRPEQLAALPSSSRHPVFMLTVEFATDSMDEDVTTANNEEPQDSCLSTEEPCRDAFQTLFRCVHVFMDTYDSNTRIGK